MTETGHDRQEMKEALLRLAPGDRLAVLEALQPEELEALTYDWSFWQRPEQRTPAGNWRYWLALAGRGWGKTRTGAEWVRENVDSGRARSIGLIGRTLGDARGVMVLGPAGIIATGSPWNPPCWNVSNKTVTWANGAIAYVYSSEEPDSLRGPGLDLCWGDEVAAWVRLQSTWTMMDMVLRMTGPLGDQPRFMGTTTPRPVKVVRDLVEREREGKFPRAVITRGSTYENADNLDPAYFATLLDIYEGTTIGRQELRAEIVDDTAGALWTSARIDAGRVKDYPAQAKLLVAVDPAVTSTKKSSETGIVVVGGGVDGDVYVHEDLSGRLSPMAWAKRAVEAFWRWEADAIVAEVNNGGDLVAANIHQCDPRVPVAMVRASRGKRVRAEPIAALYEKVPARVHHVGSFPALEKQMCEWTGDDDQSPDRLDALVWGATKIALEHIETLNVGFA